MSERVELVSDYQSEHILTRAVQTVFRLVWSNVCTALLGGGDKVGFRKKREEGEKNPRK